MGWSRASQNRSVSISLALICMAPAGLPPLSELNFNFNFNVNNFPGTASRQVAKVDWNIEFQSLGPAHPASAIPLGPSRPSLCPGLLLGAFGDTYFHSPQLSVRLFEKRDTLLFDQELQTTASQGTSGRCSALCRHGAGLVRTKA